MPSFSIQEIQVSRIDGVGCFEAIANVKGTFKPSPGLTRLLLQTILVPRYHDLPFVVTIAKSMKLHNVPRAQVSYCVATMQRIDASIARKQFQAPLGFVADCRLAVLHCSGLSWCGLDAIPHGRMLLVGS